MGKVALEAVKASPMKVSASPKDMSYTDGGNFTAKGYPNKRNVKNLACNTPGKIGTGRSKMG